MTSVGKNLSKCWSGRKGKEVGSFVDIMGGWEEKTGVESGGFTFAEILQRADMLSETVLEGVVDSPDLPSC